MPAQGKAQGGLVRSALPAKRGRRKMIAVWLVEVAAAEATSVGLLVNIGMSSVSSSEKVWTQRLCLCLYSRKWRIANTRGQNEARQLANPQRCSWPGDVFVD